MSIDNVFKPKRLFVDVDYAAMKYFKLSQPKYVKIIETKVCELNKKKEIVDFNEIVCFVGGWYACKESEWWGERFEGVVVWLQNHWGV